MYYLQSRYYDPETGRFINADALTSTGQGLLGNNMFAYCGNNPINNSDPSGRAFLNNAWRLLNLWLYGNGDDQHYDSNDSLTKRIERSAKMEDIVTNAITQYKQGVDSDQWNNGQVTFNANDDLDLYLAARTCSYKLEITTETRTTGMWFWKKEQEKHVASVTVYDLYDFTQQDWDSVGNYLNNAAWIAHDTLNVGKDYWWYATYTYETDWERIS